MFLLLFLLWSRGEYQRKEALAYVLLCAWDGRPNFGLFKIHEGSGHPPLSSLRMVLGERGSRDGGLETRRGPRDKTSTSGG